MKRLAAILLLSTLLLTGCWSRREVNDLGVVMTLAIDLTESGSLRTWLVLAQPGASGQAKGATGQTGHFQRKVVLVREGRTLAEAMRAAEQAAPRRLALHHAQLILLGERLVETGLDNLLDSLLRNPDIRLTASVAVLRGAPMERLLSAEPIMESMQSVAIREMEAGQAGLSLRLKDLFIARAMRHKAALLPVILLRAHTTFERGSPQVEPELSGAALFHNGRVATYLDASQVRGAMWLLGQVKIGVITTPCPGEPGKFVSARVTDGKGRVRTWTDGKRIRFGVSLSGDVMVTESQCNLDLSDLPTLNRVRDHLTDDLIGRVTGVIDLCKGVPADPFQFGELARVNYPELWRQIERRWSEYWAEIPVTVSAKITVINVGTSSTPPVLAPNASR